MASELRPAEEVREHILATTRRVSDIVLDYTEAVGRVLSAAVVSDEDVPPFANSAMDGYAVRSTDVETPGATLTVLDEIPAGQVAARSVGVGEAMKIMTGAPLPSGADTVVRVEDTTSSNGMVRVGSAVPKGTYVRPPGGDVTRGTTVIEGGTRLTPVHVGVLAALGLTKVTVASRPRVGVMSTGDELTPPETASPGPGMIRDSNRPMLMTMVEGAGGIGVDLGHVGDDPRRLGEVLERDTGELDVVITTGGVSMGDYDVVKALLRGSDVDFLTVAINPGKPLAYGAIEGRPFFGLPGNPVSVLVSFEQFARPALLAMQGATALLRPRITGVAGEDLHSDPVKEAFIRVRVVDPEQWVVVSTGGQSSNVLSGAGRADCFAVIPVGVASVRSGESVTLELFRASETRRVA